MNLTLCEKEGLAVTSYIHLSSRANVSLAILMSFIDVFTIIANLTVIAAMIWSHVRRRRNLQHELNNNNHITKLVIGSTAVANVFIGVFIMPLGILEMINKGKWTLGGPMCRARLTVLMILCTVSAYHVMCLALDRYMSLCKPFKYRLLTTKIGCCMAAACWGIPVICLTVPSTAGWHLMGFEETAKCNDLRQICDIVYNSASFVTLVVASLYIPFLVSFILYTLVLVEVRNFNKRKTKYHRREHRERMSIFYINDISVEDFPPNYIQSDNQELNNMDEASARPDLSAASSSSISGDSQSKKFQSGEHFAQSKKSSTCVSTCPQQISIGNMRAICTVGSIVVCYTICWLPLWICSMMTVLLSKEIPFGFFVLIVWFATSHAAVNPILFCLNRSIRRAVRYFLCSKYDSVGMK